MSRLASSGPRRTCKPRAGACMLHRWCFPLLAGRSAWTCVQMASARLSAAGIAAAPGATRDLLSPTRQAAAAWRAVQAFRSSALTVSCRANGAAAPALHCGCSSARGAACPAAGSRAAAPSRHPPAGSSRSCSTSARASGTAQGSTAVPANNSDDDDREAAAADGGQGGVPLPEVGHISSTSNSYVKHLVKLRTSSRYRREQSRCLLVGSDLIAEAAGACRDLQVRVLLLPDYTPEAAAAASAVRTGPQRSVPVPPRGARATSAANHSNSAGARGAPASDAAGGSTSRSGSSSSTHAVLQRVAAGAQATVRVSEGVMKKVSGLESVAGVEAVAELDLPPARTLREVLRHAAAGGSGGSSSIGGEGLPGQQAGAQLARVLVLDAVQDPGNLGTLARSALAFGWDALYLLPGCVDPYNDKAVRASRGALLRLPTCGGELGELAQAAAQQRLLLLSADLEDDAHADVLDLDPDLGMDPGVASLARRQPAVDPRDQGAELGARRSWSDAQRGGRGDDAPAGIGPCVDAPPQEGLGSVGQLLPAEHHPVAGGSGLAGGGGGSDVDGNGGFGGICLVLGSEGRGLSEEARRLCTPVSIPMEGRMESLNVGVAGGILMFELSRGAALLQRKLAARVAAAAAAARPSANDGEAR